MRKSGYNEMTESAKKVFEELEPDDLQENHKEIADVVGFDNLIRLIDHFGGNQIYIPQKYELYRQKMYKEIIDQYDGTNVKRLATEYGVSEKTVYTIINEKLAKVSRQKQLEGQLSFADIGIECPE
ncbi:MAG: hypothetical protein HFI48_05825 [Lachnospiraceae bacterium]|nr:hypothetical protein [Lachnospiraceae bacterium]